ETSSHEQHTEARSEEHTINGHPIDASAPAPSAGDGKPRPSQADLKGIIHALDQISMVDRVRQLRNLMDEDYLTGDQVGQILKPIPLPDRHAALDVMACSVLDPEHASHITGVVGPNEAEKAISILTQRCFAKFPEDPRPPGKMGRRPKAPPGAIRFP